MRALEKQRSLTLPAASVPASASASPSRSASPSGSGFGSGFGSGSGSGSNSAPWSPSTSASASGPARLAWAGSAPSAEYCARAEAFAAARVQAALRRLAALHVGRGGVVDRSEWRLARSGGRRNPIACYRRADGRDAAQLLAVGAVAGGVEELLHGLLSLSAEAMQVESAVGTRDLLDGRVLAVARAPSLGAPLRSLALKWALRSHEDLARRRDYVFLEATGTVDARTLAALGLPPDQPVGYHLVHSVAAPDAGPAGGPAGLRPVRGAASYCALFRQRGPRDLELFFRGRLHPRGGARDARAFQLAADTALATPRRVELGLMKKLAFSLRTRAPPGAALSDPGAKTEPGPGRDLDGRDRDRDEPQHAHHRDPRRVRSRGAELCGVCRRSVRARLFGRRAAACELCAAPACARCRVAKRVFVVQDGLFHPAKMDFCSECVAAATQMSAAWVAAQELAAADALVDGDEDSPGDAGAGGGRDSVDSVDSVDMVDMVSLVDEEVQQRLTMSADGLGSLGAGGGSLGAGGLLAAKQRVWLPSDRVRPTLAGAGMSPPEPLDAPPAGKEGASGPPDGLFVPNDADEDAIPMIDMPSDGEDEDEDEGDEDAARFHRSNRPQTDLSYLY